MHTNEQLVGLLLNAADLCASEKITKCGIEECIFEKKILSFLRDARTEDIDVQDIVAITLTALAAVITKPESPRRHNKNLQMALAVV